MPLLFHLSVWTKGNLKNEWKNCVSSVLTRPKMCNQTPRHSSTNHTKKQGTINSKVEHWDYTTIVLSFLSTLFSICFVQSTCQGHQMTGGAECFVTEGAEHFLTGVLSVLWLGALSVLWVLTSWLFLLPVAIPVFLMFLFILANWQCSPHVHFSATCLGIPIAQGIAATWGGASVFTVAVGAGVGGIGQSFLLWTSSQWLTLC